MASTQIPTASDKKPDKMPPRPPLVLHVGVTGHRPDPSKRVDPDVGAIRGVVRQVLGLIQNTVHGIAITNGPLFEQSQTDRNSLPPVTLRILSSLAEGADQWVVAEALTLGYKLHSPLPFVRDEYAKDFEGQALSEYKRLLNEAKSVLELDGSHLNGRAPASYEAAGRAIIQQSDLLIAIWDGQEEKGRGGAAQVVREALQCGVPVIWVHWTTQSGEWRLMCKPNWQLLERPDDKEDDSRHLTDIISSILLPPDLSVKPAWREKDCLRDTYYSETQPKWSWLHGFWIFFRNCVVMEKPQWSFRILDFKDETVKEWGKEQESWEKKSHFTPEASGSFVMKEINDLFLPYYAWANQLSIYYAGMYRSSFVLIYLLGALAVCFALLGIPALVHHAKAPWSIIVELLLIGTVIFLARWGHRCRWHERWIQYRTLAERLRYSRFMALLGGWRQQTTLPGHLTGYGDPVNTWMYWHYRTVERFCGIPNTIINESRLKAIQFAFHEILAQGQINYHTSNYNRLHRMDRRLRRMGDTFFFATFISCAIHLGIELAPGAVPLWSAILLIILNALLPACGAALAAIRSQGEFHRIAQRSDAMKEQLSELRQRLSFVSTTSEELHSQEMRRIIEQIVQLMLNETLDWQIVFQDRPLVLPA